MNPLDAFNDWQSEQKENMNIETKVHILGHGEACSKCGAFVGHNINPMTPAWRLGEFIGVIYYGGEYRSSYRIGKNNRQSTCDGIPWQEFKQESLRGAHQQTT